MGKISKKLNPSKINHPNSRKAQQFIRQKHKEAARDKKKLTSFMRLSAFGEKLMWFQENLDSEVEDYTPKMLAKLIEKYLSRFEDEMNILQSRKPYEAAKFASRKDQIRHIIEDEVQEYNGCGLEVPDILNKKNLQELRKWNGELRYLQNLVVARYNRKQLEKAAVNI